MSIWKVSIFRQIGGLPNPEVDQLLGSDQDSDWEITGTLSENRHTIYAVAYDKAGNISSNTSRNIIVLPDPLKVSSGIDWQIGEIGAVRIGACN